MYLLLAGIAAVLGSVIALFRYRRSARLRNTANRNKVIDLKRATQVRRSQPCTYCSKKSDRLVFYADGSRVIGVCPDCRPRAERRDLNPL